MGPRGSAAPGGYGNIPGGFLALKRFGNGRGADGRSGRRSSKVGGRSDGEAERCES